MSNPTVTMMTACHNRVHHLKETLLKNLEDNPQPFVRFVVLNYNSEDDMDAWMQAEVAQYIPSGRVLYIHEQSADGWKHSHARNIMVRAAGTDIVCNVDADNWTGVGFGKWLSALYQKHIGKQKIFTGYGPPEGCPRGDYYGRVSFWRKHLVAMGGYNEDMNTWGAEDWDIARRAEAIGLKRVAYPKEFWVEPIGHTNAERIVGTVYDNVGESHVDMLRRHAGKFAMGMMTPNARGSWGVATVRVNWKKTIHFPLGPEETLT